jgi:hypothetical protein
LTDAVEKVFLTGEPNFSAPPVHAARADVRDHLESNEGDHRASYAPDRGLQERRQANTVFREILRAAHFSTFSTASVIKRLADRVSQGQVYIRNLAIAPCSLSRFFAQPIPLIAAAQPSPRHLNDLVAAAWRASSERGPPSGLVGSIFGDT